MENRNLLEGRQDIGCLGGADLPVWGVEGWETGTVGACRE